MYLISILYAREKKVKNFFYIERYINDLHRPTSFFSWRGGKKILQIENGSWYVDTTHAQPYPSKNFRFLGKVCKRPALYRRGIMRRKSLNQVYSVSFVLFSLFNVFSIAVYIKENIVFCSILQVHFCFLPCLDRNGKIRFSSN